MRCQHDWQQSASDLYCGHRDTTADRPGESITRLAVLPRDPVAGFAQHTHVDADCQQHIDALQVSQAQKTSSSLLYTSASDIAGDKSVDYTSCSLEKSFVVTGSPLSQAELTETTGPPSHTAWEPILNFAAGKHVEL